VNGTVEHARDYVNKNVCSWLDVESVILMPILRSVFEKKGPLISQRMESEYSVANEKVNHTWNEGHLRPLNSVTSPCELAPEVSNSSDQG